MTSAARIQISENSPILKAAQEILQKRKIDSLGITSNNPRPVLFFLENEID